ELKTSATRVVPDQIHRNSHEPCHRAALSTEGASVLVGFPEAVLSQCFGKIPIAYRRKYKAKDAGPILLNKSFNVLDCESRVFHAKRDEPGCRRWLHTVV